jgi:hypothetical protein
VGVELGATLERLPGRATVTAAYQPPFLHCPEHNVRITGGVRGIVVVMALLAVWVIFVWPVYCD